MNKFRDKFPSIPDRISGIAELAYNLWWSWHPAARMLFKILNRATWKESGHNPVKMLGELPVEILKSAASDPEYLHQHDVVYARFREDIESRVCWFSENITDPECLPIAYFSAEYGLHHSLPFYAGGLGFLAGDYIKECSDLGVPMVAVGFMYPEGYLHQKIRMDGWQENPDEILDRDAAPIVRVLNEKGEQLVVKVPFIDPPIYVAVWKIAVGRISLYLVDTDIEMNDPWNRSIAYHLYIGDIEQRLRQEIVLGIGGSEVLNTIGIKHSVLHLNEGHCAFALLERIREKIEEGMSFKKAAEQGFLCPRYPVEMGGGGGDKVTECIMVEELNRVNAGIASSLMAQSGLATQPIYNYGSAEQKEKFLIPAIQGAKVGAFGLTEPNAGSDAASIKTTAVRDGANYVINGTK